MGGTHRSVPVVPEVVLTRDHVVIDPSNHARRTISISMATRDTTKRYWVSCSCGKKRKTAVLITPRAVDDWLRKQHESLHGGTTCIVRKDSK